MNTCICVILIHFRPVAGILLWIVATANFSSDSTIIMTAQIYIIAFHMGGFFYHVRLGHPPVTGCAPAMFAFLSTVIIAIRTKSIVLAYMMLMGCTGVAYVLSLILVKPQPHAAMSYSWQHGAAE